MTWGRCPRVASGLRCALSTRKRVSASLWSCGGAALATALLLAGCGSNSTTPTTATATSTESTEFYAGALDPRGSGFYSFTVTQSGSVRVTLTNLSTTRFAPLSNTLELGIGTPAGEGCAVTERVTAAPALNAHLVSTRSAGIHCVEVRDRGSLASQMSFIIRITHP